MVSAYETASGIKPGMWLERFLSCFEEVGRGEMGYLFTNYKKRARRIGEYDTIFHERLEEVLAARPDLFPPGINIREDYSLLRSLRRGSTTLATVKRVRTEVIDMNNRWRKIEKAMGRAPSQAMRQLYSEMLYMLESRLEYSSSF